MRGLAVLLALAISQTASAEEAPNPSRFTGTWQGQGIYVLKGEFLPCPDFVLVFKGTPDQFTFVSGHRSCGKIEETFAEVGMDARDGTLSYTGRPIGSYGTDTLQAAFRQPEGDGRFRNWRMSMRREGNNLVYEERRTMDGEETPMISFAGILVLAAE